MRYSLEHYVVLLMQFTNIVVKRPDDGRISAVTCR